MTPAAVPAPAGPPDELLPDEPMCVDGTDDSGAVHPRPDLVRAAAPAATGERERADLLAEWDEHGEAVAFVAIRNYAGSANAKHIADYATDWFRRWLATLGRDAPEPREGGAQWRT